MSDPTSAARWAITGVLILGSAALVALVLLWAEDVRAMRTEPRGFRTARRAWAAVRTVPARLSSRWLVACCWCRELHFLARTMIGAHR